MTQKLALGSFVVFSMTSLVLVTLPVRAQKVTPNNSHQHQTMTPSGNANQSHHTTQSSSSGERNRAQAPTGTHSSVSSRKPATNSSALMSPPAHHLTATPTTNAIHLGSRGENVRALQEALNKQGLYQGSVDGIFGRGTRAAVIAFQRKHGLHADGIVGSRTQAALRQ